MSSKESLQPWLRDAVKRRDSHECSVCGARGPEAGGCAELHVHHRVPEEEGGSSDPENLATLCKDCHNHHHSRRRLDDLPKNRERQVEKSNLDPTPADLSILVALGKVAPASTGTIAKEATLSAEHTRRRLYHLAAEDLVAIDVNRRWDYADEVDEPAAGRLPESPERAAQMARDDCIRQMVDWGLSNREIADIVGLDERTIPVACNRARAYDPAMPALSDEEIDVAELARRIEHLERQLDEQ